jgi:hypothetical protein
MARPSASAPVQFAEPRAGASAFDVITVDNLSKRFGDFWATLFQCFAGIAPATLGVGERDATRVAPDDRKHLLFFRPRRRSSVDGPVGRLDAALHRGRAAVQNGDLFGRNVSGPPIAFLP